MGLLSSKKKRLVLPIFLIFFLFSILLVGWLQKANLNFNLELLKKQEMVSPILPPTQKENLESLLKKEGLIPTSLNFQEKEIQASFSGDLTAIFSMGSLEKDLSSQVISLQFILSRAKIEGRLPKVVDLRFDKPVVLYK